MNGKYITATKAFWLAIGGLYLIAVLMTFFVIMAVLGNRDVQYDTLSRIQSIDCVLAVTATHRTDEHIKHCRTKYDVEAEATPVER